MTSCSDFLFCDVLYMHVKIIITVPSERTQPIIRNATPDMLREHILPVAEKLKVEAQRREGEEEAYLQEKRRGGGELGDGETVIQEAFQTLVRDMYAFYPLLIKFVDLHRSAWLKEPSSDAEMLYVCVAEVFNLWSKSHVSMTSSGATCTHSVSVCCVLQIFKKEEQNFVYANEIDNMALIMPSQDKKSAPSGSDATAAKKPKKMGITQR